MPENWSEFTVFFEAPFWVGVYQRAEDGALRACRVVFGAEPRDAEVYRFLLRNWHRLPFGPALPGQSGRGAIQNPKRRQREARRQTDAGRGVGTRAQQALQLQREAGKQQRQMQSKRQREEEQARQFALRRQKKREKHKGH